jgi:hypothetical protein
MRRGGVVRDALVRLSSPALIGGQETLTTNEKGQPRFPILPPGDYEFDIELQGFASYHEAEIRIGAGATIERTVVLQLAGVAESIVVQGAGSRIEARDPGFGTRFGPEDVRSIPTRRNSMFDFIKAAPGTSPTAPSSGKNNTISAFGSSTNENHFLFDGTNFTCPCNGVARAEPGIDFIQEVQVQSVGASAEFGNAQGAVINVVTRQGSARFLYDDMTTNLGGPVVRDRVWFFTGYQYLRDYDSHPGADPAWPRTYEQNKLFVKITSRLTHGTLMGWSEHTRAKDLAIRLGSEVSPRLGQVVAAWH